MNNSNYEKIELLSESKPISDDNIEKIVSYYKIETNAEIGLLYIIVFNEGNEVPTFKL